MKKVYSIIENASQRWDAFFGNELRCGGYTSQEFAIIGLANYIKAEELQKELLNLGLPIEKLMLKSYSELLEIEKEYVNSKLTLNEISDAKKYREYEDYISFFELFFGVEEYKDGLQLETWTEGGVNMIHYFHKKDGCYFKQFIEFVQNFEVDEEIEIHRQGESYRNVFTYRKSLEDFEDYLDWITVIAEII